MAKVLVLSGGKFQYTDLLTSGFTPSNYTNATDSLEDHLDGIDDALLNPQGTMLPDTTNTHDLGGTSNYYKDFFLQGYIEFNNDASAAPSTSSGKFHLRSESGVPHFQFDDGSDLHINYSSDEIQFDTENNGAITFQNAAGSTGPVAVFTPFITTASREVKADGVNSTTNLDDSFHFLVVDTNGGNVTINLPSSGSTAAGKIYWIKNIGGSGNQAQVTPNGSDTIDGAGSVNLNDGQALAIVNDGNNIWFCFVLAH